jgi:hypothetical protein
MQALTQERVLTGKIIRSGGFVVREREETHRAVMFHRKASDLVTDFRIHHVHQLVSWSVAVDLERGDLAAQVPLAPLRSEDELACARVQSVRTDNEIERANLSGREADRHVRIRLRDAIDRVA